MRFATNALAALCVTWSYLPASAQTTIRVDGAIGSMPLVQALAKVFQGKHPGITIEFGKGLDREARIEALDKGAIDIALASQGLDAIANRGMSVTEIARTAVVFAVNASVGVSSLTGDQICGIFTGSITNWNQVGGPDLAIAASSRPESEVDTGVIRDGVTCLKSVKFSPTVKIIPRGIDMVRELAGTTGAMGVTSANLVEQSGRKIKALALEGVAASEMNVVSGKYRLIREVFLVVKMNATPPVQQFISFIRSVDGAAVIKANGALPAGAKQASSP